MNNFNRHQYRSVVKAFKKDLKNAIDKHSGEAGGFKIRASIEFCPAKDEINDDIIKQIIERISNATDDDINDLFKM